MPRALRLLLPLALAATLAACDPSGKPMDDIRLTQLKPGTSTEQDVRRLFREPEAIIDLPDGKGLRYPLGPEGAATLLLVIGRDGRFVRSDNVLVQANFDRVRPGMSADDVRALIGPPGRTEQYRLKRQSAAEWKFLAGGDARLFVVTYDEAGKVVGTAVETPEQRRIGG